MPAILLENWSIGSAPFDPYQPPEAQAKFLQGKVYHHPCFREGDQITTSAIIKVVGDRVMTKSGRLYELGKVDPNYERAYPNARERLFKSWS